MAQNVQKLSWTAKPPAGPFLVKFSQVQSTKTRLAAYLLLGSPARPRRPGSRRQGRKTKPAECMCRLDTLYSFLDIRMLPNARTRFSVLIQRWNLTPDSVS